MAAATFAGLAKFLLPLAFPWMLKVLLDDVVLQEGVDAAARERKIIQLIVAILAANVVWMIATYYRSVLAAIAGHRMIRDLRVALFSHVQRLSHAFFARHQTGAIVSRLVSDISLAQNFVGSALTNVWMDIVLLIALVVILTVIHPMMTLVSLVLMPVYVYALHALGPRIRLSSKEVQQRLEVLSGGLQEKVAGVTIVKGFAREGQETQIFASHANKLLNKILYSARFTAWNEVVVGFVVHSAPVLVVWYGVHQILGGRLTVGELTQFLLYLGMFYFPLQRLSDLSVVLANSLAAIDRIFEYFDTQPHVSERPDAARLDECQGRIEFVDVVFGYDSSAATLKDIRLSIAPGQTVAVVGPSGAGKSTLANLVPRFYDPTEGRILLDGRDLRELELASLRRHIGIVNQETILFSGTVQENLLLAKPDATPDEMRAALEAANAIEFVERLPEGLWTEIGERGATLSGGQKQRLAIARAFLKDPRILILDEATSSLDSRAERHIQQALARLLKNRTSIVIAHRLSTILRADQIVVMEAGRIVDLGRHAELLARGGLYAQLYNEQFGQVELPRAG
ncbi:multidrug ABC transporter ATP-binding protein [Sulfurifustis variabilis]|uniref:Multidrug ABC transporter ATP-binding protein n=1 Tax=Sulfurifustis variabilis TaxID=1675686 RepID=A0A1B4VBA8_9GAMM|nr:multidrug ABC transporter ATP-binding protein [Sulfurifustis variabilis]